MCQIGAKCIFHICLQHELHAAVAAKEASQYSIPYSDGTRKINIFNEEYSMNAHLMEKVGLPLGLEIVSLL